MNPTPEVSTARILELLEAMNARITATETMLRELSRSQAPSDRSRSLSVAAETPASASPERPSQLVPKPKVPIPPEFSGKVYEYRNFVAQCNLSFGLCPASFPTDETRVLFIISRLRGDALTYARSIIENPNHPLRHNFNGFAAFLDNVYLDQGYEDKCAHRLHKLKQTKSAASYAVEFKSLIAPLDLNEKAKMLQYFKGLNAKLQEAIAVQGRASTFEHLVQQSIRIDQAQFHARQNSSAESNRSAPPKSSANSMESNSEKRPPRSSHPPAPTSNSVSNMPYKSSPYASSLPRAPLTEAQKKHRKDNNLCMYCGDNDHDVDHCPRKAKAQSTINHASTAFIPYVHAVVGHSENSEPQAPVRSEV